MCISKSSVMWCSCAVEPKWPFYKCSCGAGLTSKAAQCIFNHETCQQLQAEMFPKKKKKEAGRPQADTDYCLHHCIFLTSRKQHLCISLNMEASQQGETQAFPLLGKEVQRASKAATQPTPSLGSKATDNQGWGRWRGVESKWQALPLAGIYLNG